MAIIKTEGSSITESTPAQCLKKSYHIGKTEYTNICANSTEFTKEEVPWGSLQWGGFALTIIILALIVYKFLKR